MNNDNYMCKFWVEYISYVFKSMNAGFSEKKKKKVGLEIKLGSGNRDMQT